MRLITHKLHKYCSHYMYFNIADVQTRKIRKCEPGCEIHKHVVKNTLDELLAVIMREANKSFTVTQY